MCERELIDESYAPVVIEMELPKGYIFKGQELGRLRRAPKPTDYSRVLDFDVEHSLLVSE